MFLLREAAAEPLTVSAELADLPTLRVGLLGLGTVGGEVARGLLHDAERLAARGGGCHLELVAVGVRDPGRRRSIELPPEVDRTADLHSVVERGDIDVIVELLGGQEPARELVRLALASGRSVVTANKALVAVHGAELEGAARSSGAALRFEAAVAGGVPVLGPLTRELAANTIVSVRGIVNGTTNFIMSEMAANGSTYLDALHQAQAQGYAEADPSADVEGLDAAHKLVLLIRLAFGAWVPVEGISRAAPALRADGAVGITGVRLQDMTAARELGLTLKLVASAAEGDANITAAVLPTAVPIDDPIGVTDGVTNIVEVTGEPIGRVWLRGPGAGGRATRSAVLADLLALARGEGSTWAGLPAARPMPTDDALDSPRRWCFSTDGLSTMDLDTLSAQLPLSGKNLGRVTGRVALPVLRQALAATAMPPERLLYPVLDA